MQNFIQRAAQKANQPGAVTDTPEQWAARAFSVLAILGGLDVIDDNIGEDLATALSKAPDEVLMAGTMAILAARASAMGDKDDNDNLGFGPL